MTYQTSWTGTPTGVISIEASLDNVNFYALTDFNPAINQPAGSADGGLICVRKQAFEYIRLAYTNASGSGALTVFIAGGDVN